MKNSFFMISLTLAFIVLMPSVDAQVTVGSGIEPRKGLLLDLKENANAGKESNSNKGLALPRVALSSPDTLTIDDDAAKNDYIGTVVYNTTTNDKIMEGVYCWNGKLWEASVNVENFGTKGQILQSNGDNTNQWISYSPAMFRFSKPTQIKKFDIAKMDSFAYSYDDITQSQYQDQLKTYAPKPGIFKYNYKDILDVKSENTKDKFLLLGVIAYIYKNTLQRGVAKNAIWEIDQIDVTIDDAVIKSFKRTISTPFYGSTVNTIDIFSIIQLPALDKGEHELKIKVSNVKNTFPSNGTTDNSENNYTKGFFYIYDTGFLQCKITDVNFVLYENE